MKRVFVALCAIGLFYSCDKKDNDPRPDDSSIVGRYTGYFIRSGMDTATVQMAFSVDNTFQGNSSRDRYPAICAGTYTYSDASGTLVVNDTCNWTADFDWTLIFDGTYTVTQTGENSIRIWRTSGAVTDEYLLNKMIR